MNRSASPSILHAERDLEYYKEIAPVGFGFYPTTNDLFQYLRCKKSGDACANIIKEVVPLHEYTPIELQRNFNKGKGDELYLFTTTNRQNGSRKDRRAGNGRWKNIGVEEIMEDNTLIGYKSVLNFVDEKKKKTCWNMHEYSLPLVDHGRKRKMKDSLVLCKIYCKRSKSKPYEAFSDESILGSSVADGEARTDINISQCPTYAPDDLDQYLLDVIAADCPSSDEQFGKKYREFEEILQNK